VDRLANGVEKHVPSGRGGRGFAEIQKNVAAVSEMCSQKAAAADVAAAWIYYGLGVADRDGGIDGVAALTEHFYAGFGGQVLGGYHQAGC
jgi:hypothetical protein